MAKPIKPFWMFKAPMSLKDKLDEVRRERIKRGKDKKQVSYNRLGLAISRHDAFLNELANANFLDDNKAQFNIITFIVVAVLAVLLFGGLIYAQGIIYDVFHQAGVINDALPHQNYTFPCIGDATKTCGGTFSANMTEAADATFGVLNNSIQSLRLVALMMILGMAACIIVTNSLVSKSPLWFFAYILICGLMIIFCVPVSNAYLSVMNSGIYDGGLLAFTGSNYILLNLPAVVLIMSVLGGIFLFINVVRGGGQQANLG